MDNFFESNHVFFNCFIFLIFIVPSLFDIAVRNNMVYDEYDFYFDPSRPNQGDHDDSTIFYSMKKKLKDELINSKKFTIAVN